MKILNKVKIVIIGLAIIMVGNAQAADYLCLLSSHGCAAKGGYKLIKEGAREVKDEAGEFWKRNPEVIDEYWEDIETLGETITSEIAELKTSLPANAWETAGTLFNTFEKEDCGKRNAGELNWIFTNVFIPDYFPSDEVASLVTAPYVSSVYDGGITMEAPNYEWWFSPLCAPFGIVHLYESCREHDDCMDLKGSTGKSSKTCDVEIRDNWHRQCRETYSEGSICRSMCEDVTQFSYEIMAANTSFFEENVNIVPSIITPLLLN